MSEALKTIDVQESALGEFAQFEHFSKALLDAYVVLDHQGQIVKVNPMLSQLTGMKSRQLLKCPNFEAIMSLSIDGKPLNFDDLIQHDGPTRIDEVRGNVKGRDEVLNLILGVYPLINAQSNRKLGVFLLLRDVTAETNLQGQYKDKAIQSITDPLTSLFTRAYFEEYLSGQVTRMESLPPQERYPISVVMCDIDFFKKINDKHGHQAGDYVIRTVCQIMKTTFRKTDICCRYGGEEFLVILPAANYDNASLAAEKLRQAIQNAVLIFEDTPIPVTISCGVATIKITQETYTDTMARADAALYEAKHKGRNAVFIHDGSQLIPAIKGETA